MKLSELIQNLQNVYDKYGDGLVFTLDECATREAIGIECNPEYEYVYSAEGIETSNVKKVEYCLYGYGYSY